MQCKMLLWFVLSSKSERTVPKMSQENMIFGCSRCLAGLFMVACSFVNIYLFNTVWAFCKCFVMSGCCYPLSLLPTKTCSLFKCIWYFLIPCFLSTFLLLLKEHILKIKNRTCLRFIFYDCSWICIYNTCKFFFLWNVIVLALTLRSLMSTLFPQRTMGMFSHTLTRSLCQLGTFLYVTLEVTSNMIMAHWPWM